MTNLDLYKNSGLIIDKSATIFLQYKLFKLEIKFAGKSNPKYTSAILKVSPKLTALERKKKFDAPAANVESNDILAQIYADSIIVGYDKIQDPKTGEMLTEYDAEVMKDILLAVPELFADIQAQASDSSLFNNLESLDEELGNSVKPTKKP